LIFKNELLKSGTPIIKIFDLADSKAIYVSERVKDWDGVDINMRRLKLLAGNKYQVTVTGCIDGLTPDETLITLQGIPGYSWRDMKYVGDSQAFTLRHILSQSEVDQWDLVRITTNATGATVPFYIYSIEIKRLGLL
jgi:endo-1,4-beta-xylanase